MAQEIVGIKIQVDGQEKVLQSMGEVRKELKAAQFDVLKFSETFGASSKEAVEAAKRVAELRDAIGDAKDLVGAFNPDAKFKAFSGAVQGVVGGFAALQGAMGLIGVEGEEVEKTLLKVQSALAISEGLDSVMASIDAFKNLGAVIQSTSIFQKANAVANTITATTMRALGISAETTSLSFKVLKTAIVSTGIGLLVIALGEAVSAFQNFQNSADKAAESQKNLNDKISESAKNSLKIELDFLANQEKIDIAKAKARGASEKEIFEIEQGYRRQKGQAQIRYWQEVKGADKKGAEDAKGEVDKINADAIVAKANFDAKVLADKKQKDKERADKEKQIAKERADAEKQAGDELIKLRNEIAVLGIKDEYEAKREAINNQLAIDIEQVKKNEKIKTETKTALITALELKSQAEIVAIVNEETEAAQKDSAERLKKQQEDERAILAGGIQSRIELLDKENAAIEMDYEQDLERLSEKRELLAEQEAIELSNTELTEFQKFEIKKKYADQRNEVTKQEVEVEKAAQQSKIDLNNRYLDLASQFGGVLQQIAGKNKALAIAGVVVEQAASIGRIISNTGVANAKAIAASPLTAGQPFVAINSISAGLSIASSVAAGLKAVQQINSAQPGGGGGASPVSGASAAAPISPAAPITNTVTQLDNQSIDRMGSATNRAYVVESDVSNSQERIKRINRAARLT
jgi:hypothetical protein